MKQVNMILKSYAWMLIFILIAANAPDVTAQSLNDFYDDFWAVYWVNTSMERTGNDNIQTIGKPTPEKYSYSSITFAWRSDNTREWGWHFDYQHRFLGDLVYVLYKSIADYDNSDEYTDRIKNNSLHNGYFGDLNMGMNVIGSDRLVVSTGLNISDHMIDNNGESDEFEDDDDNRSGHHAYHFALGGYAHMDFAILGWLAARVTVTAAKAVTATRALNSRRLYKPLFISIQPEIFTSYGFFIGLDYYNAIHDDPVKQNRLDIKAGIRF